MHEKNVKPGLEMLWREFGEKRVQAAVAAVKKFSVEVPSWVFGRFGGGRFGGYMPPGGARTIEEKLDDAAFIHRLTGATPAVAMHTLWDFSSDGRAADLDVARRVSQAARQRGLQVGAVNPTYFLEGSYRGSMSADEKDTVQRYIEQTVVSGAIARRYGNGMVTLWFPDGSAYPGQRQLRRAFETLIDACVACRRRIPNAVRILIADNGVKPGSVNRLASVLGGCVGVGDPILPMNKAELTEAIAKESKLSSIEVRLIVPVAMDKGLRFGVLKTKHDTVKNCISTVR